MALILGGDGTITGNPDITLTESVSIAGTVTYEDVTNIDSVGIITARAGLNVTGGDVKIGTTNNVTFGSRRALTVANGVTGGVISLYNNTTATANPRISSNPGGSEINDIGIHAASTNGNIIAYTNNDTERFRIDSAGDVGIGTNTPSNYAAASRNLVIYDPGNAGITIRSGNNHDASIYFNDTDDGNQRGIVRFNHQTDSLAFHTPIGEALRIDSNGLIANGGKVPSNLGSPNLLISGLDSELHMMGVGTTNNVSHTGIKFRVAGDSAGDYTKAGIFAQRQSSYNDIDLLFAFRSTNDAVGVTPSDEKVRIDSDGRLLINTNLSRIVEDWSGNGPQGKIQIEGTNSDAIMSIIGNATADSFRCGTLSLGRTRDTLNSQNPPTIVQNGDNLGAINFCGSDGVDMRNKGAYIRCEVEGTPAENVMPGMLYFATRPTSGTSVIKRLKIGNGGMISSYSDAGWESQVLYNANTAATTRSLIIGRYGATALTAASGTAGTISFRVYTNGNVENTGNSYGQISDVSLKENIVDANSQWADIKAVKVRNFNFKEGQTHKQIGVIAQEIETVSPGLVYETGDNLKGVTYSVLYMKAIKALQEAMTRIETLESEVAALKGS